MKEFEGMPKIPDEILKSIVGGKLNDGQKESIAKFAQMCKNHGHSYTMALTFFRGFYEGYDGHPFTDEDWQDIEGIFQSVYGV